MPYGRAAGCFDFPTCTDDLMSNEAWRLEYFSRNLACIYVCTCVYVFHSLALLVLSSSYVDVYIFLL